MFHQPRSLIRCIAAGLAACAIAPAAAAAGPIIEGQGVAAGGGPGVTAEQFEPRSLAAPDQVDRVAGTQPAGVPTWPTGPQPAATRHAPVTATSSDDDGGLDTGVWIALGGAALLSAGGIGFAGRKRLRVIRRRQFA